MGRELTVRTALRAATAGAHERVDAVFSAFDLGDRPGYSRFLHAQAEALLPLEDALDKGAAPRLEIGWSARKRSPALLADLAALGHSAPPPERLAPIERPAAALGTIYVLEGSRLGGALLKRAVDDGFPAAFLAPGPAGAWRGLLEALDTALPTEALVNEAAAAARDAFARFERAGRAVLVRMA